MKLNEIIHVLWIEITGKRVENWDDESSPNVCFSFIILALILQGFLTHTFSARKICSKYFIDFCGRFYASMKNEKIVEEKIPIKKSSSVYMQRFPLWILRTCDVAVKISIDKEVFWLFRLLAAISSFVKAKLNWKRHKWLFQKFDDPWLQVSSQKLQMGGQK